MENKIKLSIPEKIMTVIILFIVAIVVLANMNNSRLNKETNSTPIEKDFSLYTGREYISNPEYLKNPDSYIIDSDDAISGKYIKRNENNSFAGARWLGKVWVERILGGPYLLLSYTYTRGGENIISFYLEPFNWLYIIESEEIDQECSLNMSEDMIDKIFVNKYVNLKYSSILNETEDVILKKRDIDPPLLKGVKITKCTLNTITANGLLRTLPCPSEGDDEISGRELLATNGYSAEPYIGDSQIAKIAKRGVWGACIK